MQQEVPADMWMRTTMGSAIFGNHLQSADRDRIMLMLMETVSVTTGTVTVRDSRSGTEAETGAEAETADKGVMPESEML